MFKYKGQYVDVEVVSYEGTDNLGILLFKENEVLSELTLNIEQPLSDGFVVVKGESLSWLLNNKIVAKPKGLYIYSEQDSYICEIIK